MSLFRKASPPPEPATQPGERIYAIGDVHGRADLLRLLMEKIRQDDAARGPARRRYVVVLGDLIDRGPDSARVLRMLAQAQQMRGNLIVLLGNHEELMLRALAGEPGLLIAWLRMGGDATLRSFGLDVPADNIFPRNFLDQARAAIGPELRQWLGGRPLFARSGDYFFCHAGVQPGVALARQKQGDLLWIREAFLRSTAWHGAVVVHGHSVEAEVQAHPNRIGIDTGAYRTGRLTALGLEGTERFILTACEEELAPMAPAET